MDRDRFFFMLDFKPGEVKYNVVSEMQKRPKTNGRGGPLCVYKKRAKGTIAAAMCSLDPSSIRARPSILRRSRP